MTVMPAACVVAFHRSTHRQGDFVIAREKNSLREQAKNKHQKVSNLIMENVNI